MKYVVSWDKVLYDFAINFQIQDVNDLDKIYSDNCKTFDSKEEAIEWINNWKQHMFRNINIITKALQKDNQ